MQCVLEKVIVWKRKSEAFILLILLDLSGDCERRSNLFGVEGVEEEIMEIEGDTRVAELRAVLLFLVNSDVFLFL